MALIHFIILIFYSLRSTYRALFLLSGQSRLFIMLLLLLLLFSLLYLLLLLFYYVYYYCHYIYYYCYYYYFYYVVTEDGTAMEVEADVPQATHVDHKQVLDTLSAVCTHATLVKCVIPELLEHGRNLSVGELWFQVLLLL